MLGGGAATVEGGANHMGEAAALPPSELAPLASLGTLHPAGGSGAVGPEGVSVPDGQQLTGGGSAAAGSTIDGIRCQAAEQVLFRTLGNFFDVWGETLDRNDVGPVSGTVTAIYNGRVFRGDPRQIPLTKHAQIQLEGGRPLVAPVRISFPAGL